MSANATSQESQLCEALMRADTEEAVVRLLSEAGYWDDLTLWRPINDEENNFASIGNQQSEAVAAFVEKIVNGVDARLVDACLRAGIDPESDEAPKSMREAVAQLFEDRPHPKVSDGRISDWPDADATKEGRLLTVAATGHSARKGYPSLTVADQGEGQTPDRVSDTFMSLSKSNKLRIPFVQGKFNMGGTGALQFCSGPNKLQLIVTRRNPDLLPQDATERDEQWSFTVVRREKPRNGARSSIYTYLAPVKLPGQERRGVLSFSASTWPIFPEANNVVRDAYNRHSKYGSLVKLYEYELQNKSNIVLSGDGLLRRIDVGLPELALPVRLFECRPEYKGGPGSFATNALGLVARLDRDKDGNMEEQSPIGAGITLNGIQIPLRIYVFLAEKAKLYRSARQGVVFSVNGQTHGMYPADFFRRKSVGMGYLADSLLVFADCSAIEGQMREDLFMNSRDRLRDTPLARELESRLSAVLKSEPTLRELGNRRRQQLLQDRLNEDKPLADVIQNLMKTNPMLSKLLLSGMQLSSPFPPGAGSDGATKGTAAKFVGKRFPTFFRFKDKKDGESLNRTAAIGSRPRITMETDAEDSYFVREVDRGAWNVKLKGLTDFTDAADWTWTGPKAGIARLSIDLPEDAQVGDQFEYLIEVTDPSRIDAFTCELTLNVVPEATPSTSGKPNKPKVSNEDTGTGGGSTSTLALPEVKPVHQTEWGQHEMDEHSALKVVNAGSRDATGTATYDFFINVDNKYLKIIQKDAKGDASLLEKQFTYGFVLVGLALLQDALRHETEMQKDGPGVEDYVTKTTRALAPMLIPMIQAIAQLSADEY